MRRGRITLPWASARAAREALALFPSRVRGVARRVTVGENATWRVKGQDGAAYALRLYRPGRWTDEQIAVEHDFMAFLGEDLNVTPPVAGLDGQTLQTTADGVRAALFPGAPGRFMHRGRRPVHFARLGAFLARLHDASRAYQPPGPRGSWDREELLWRAVGLIEAAWPDLMGQALCPYRGWAERLEAIWDDRAPEELFLHADLHFGNAAFHGGEVYPIDFDDCGVGPVAQDLSIVALSGGGQGARVEALLAAYGAEAGEPIDRVLVDLFMGARLVMISGWVLERRDVFADEKLVEILERQMKTYRELEGRLP